MNKNNIVTGSVPRHKSSLTWVDDFRHIGFEALHKDTGNQLVKGVAKTNWAKLGDVVRVSHFKDKDQVCMTPCWRDMKLLKNILNSLNYTLAHNVPISLKKERVKSVRSRSLQWREASKSFKNLVREGNGGQLLGMLKERASQTHTRSVVQGVATILRGSLEQLMESIIYMS